MSLYFILFLLSCIVFHIMSCIVLLSKVLIRENVFLFVQVDNSNERVKAAENQLSSIKVAILLTI